MKYSCSIAGPARARAANAARLSAAANCETYILDGGLDAWKKAGLPVTLDRSQPIDIMRQVQIAAGSLVLIEHVARDVSFAWLLCPLGLRRRRARVCRTPPASAAWRICWR